jgi:acetate kinase
MAITLVVNPGSTSRKYAFYREGTCLAHVAIEMNDTNIESCITDVHGVSTCEKWSAETVDAALAKTMDWAITQGLVADYTSITKVAVRVVAPGDFFAVHRPIDTVYKEALLVAAYLVPVHIPIVLAELAVIAELFPATPCVAISDSAFHATMWPQVSLQSLGSEQIKNYGYHGLSFASISHRLETSFGVMPKRTVVLHIGGGVSVAALYEGKAVATSMGFTPASGVVMGTRGGDVGADAMLAYMREHDLTPTDALLHLYRHSGFKALVGVADLRLVMERAAMHDEKAHLAFTGFVQQVATEVVSRALLMGGIDALVLTGTASVRNPELRARLIAPLALIGVMLDQEKNDGLIGKEGRIEMPHGIPVMVMKTDEMGEMVKQAALLN